MAREGHVQANERRKLVLRHIDLHPLFQGMAVRQGIDLEGRWWHGLESMLLRALVRCAGCGQSRACRRWSRAAAPGEAYPAFCPNTRVLEACRIMDPDAPPRPNDDWHRLPQQHPTLREVLADPGVQQVMRADRRALDRLLGSLAGAPRRLLRRLSGRN